MEKYIERQKFSKWISIGLGCLCIYMIYLMFISFGSSSFLRITLTGFLPVLLVLLLFLQATLFTRIDYIGIHIKFVPFHFRTIHFNWEDIAKCEVCKYNPLKEYLGWGIRYGMRGKAYNVRGNMGIKLQLKNGKQILIGTQKADEVEKVITEYLKN